MSRLVVNRARKQKHTRIAHQTLAPVVNILLRFKPRKADGRGVRRSPFEDVGMAGKELSEERKGAKDKMQIAINESLAVPERQRRKKLAGRAGANRRVVFQGNNLFEEFLVVRRDPRKAESRQAIARTHRSEANGT